MMSLSRLQTRLFSEPLWVERCFIFILIFHLVLWTILPMVVRHALPNDLIEAYLWSQQNAFGSDKNPWMPALIAKLGIALGGGVSVWGYYFLQQLVVVGGLFASFQLVRALSNSWYAFLSVLMLEACICYTFEVQIMNDNFLLIGLLPIACWMFYLALHNTQEKKYWMGCGLVFALAVMSKYDAILVVLGGFVYLLCYRRVAFKTPAFYLALLIFMLTMLPNLIWLWQHNFSTIRYAFIERGQFSTSSRWVGLSSSASLFYLTLINWLPGLILLLMGLSYCQRPAGRVFPVKAEAMGFIFCLGVLPFLLLNVLAIGMGFQLQREWGTTFLGLWGAFVLFYFQPRISPVSFMRFLVVLSVLMVSVAVTFIWSSLRNNAGNFPAQKLASLAEQTWNQHMKTPLKIVAGDRYIIGHITLWNRHHPRAWMEWNLEKSVNITPRDVACYGALFVQADLTDSHSAFYPGKQFPKFVMDRYPSLKILPKISVPRPYLSNGASDITVIFGILKPQCVC